MEILNALGTAAPIVAPEGKSAPKAAKRNNVPAILARKSLAGKWQKPGAPPKTVLGLTVNRKRGAFTKADIYAFNGETISMLTITKRIKALKKAGELVKMAEKAKHEGPGKPQDLYNFDLSKGVPKKQRKTRKDKGTSVPDLPVVIPEPAAPVAPAPVVEAPAPAPVEPAV